MSPRDTTPFGTPYEDRRPNARPSHVRARYRDRRPINGATGTDVRSIIGTGCVTSSPADASHWLIAHKFAIKFRSHNVQTWLPCRHRGPNSALATYWDRPPSDPGSFLNEEVTLPVPSNAG